MGFGKAYEAFCLENNPTFPRMNLKKARGVMARCRENYKSNIALMNSGKKTSLVSKHHHHQHYHPSSSCSNGGCKVCDNTFFPMVLNDFVPLVEFFKRRAKKLVKRNFNTKIQSYLPPWVQGRTSQFQQARVLVKYGVMNAIAVNKLLDRYDNIHSSNQGNSFRLKMKTGGFDILGSPELCELMAYNINVGNTYKEFKLILDNENKQLMMSYERANMPNYLKFTINLTCSICSKTVFQPVALKCGHMFCYMCACHVASVSIFHGLELANNRQMCSVCKKTRVYGKITTMKEVSLMVKKKSKGYWKQRYRDLLVRFDEIFHPSIKYFFG